MRSCVTNGRKAVTSTGAVGRGWPGRFLRAYALTGNESLGWEQGRARDRASLQAGDPEHGGGWLMEPET